MTAIASLGQGHMGVPMASRLLAAVDAATAGLSGNDISAVVASLRSRAHTLAITETRGQ